MHFARCVVCLKHPISWRPTHGCFRYISCSFVIKSISFALLDLLRIPVVPESNRSYRTVLVPGWCNSTYPVLKFADSLGAGHAWQENQLLKPVSSRLLLDFFGNVTFWRVWVWIIGQRAHQIMYNETQTVNLRSWTAKQYNHICFGSKFISHGGRRFHGLKKPFRTKRSATLSVLTPCCHQYCPQS